MKKALAIGLGLAAALALPALAADDAALKPLHHHHVYRHLHRSAEAPRVASTATAQAPAAPQSWLQTWFSHVAPYPDDQGDADGLSRDPGDCNKGCIGEP